MASDDSRTVPFTSLHHELSSFRPPPQQTVLSGSTACHQSDIPPKPSSLLLQPAGYPAPHPHTPRFPVAQGNTGSPTIQLVHPQHGEQLSRTTQGTCSPQIPRLPSLATKDTATSTVTPLPSFRELVQHLDSSAQWAHQPENDDQNPLRDIGSHSRTSPQSLDRRSLNSSSTTLRSVFSPENGYQPMPYDAEPQLWTGSQPIGQQSLYDTIPIPIMTQSGNGARGSHYHLSATEGPQVNDREILAHNQDVSSRSSPISLGDNGKRKRVPHPSDRTNSPSKRQTGATDKVVLDIEKALMNGVKNFDYSSPYQSSVPLFLGQTNSAKLTISEGSSARTTPTTTEVARPEAIEYIHGTRPSTRQANRGEFFRDANNTVIKDSMMNAIGVQQVYVQGGLSNDPELQWLKGHVMKGAEHDSADRDPPPRCHPGTRTTIIQNLQDWLENSEREKNLLWLRGAAGVGKSAIVQTIAESLSETGRLGASLFFSRPNGRSNPRQIFPTLAYRFAVQDPLYREYIVQLMRTDPESLDKAMSEQFRILIVEPFVRKGIRSGKAAWVVTLDGLDECGEDPNGRRHSNDVQRDIVHLISGFVQQYPTAPLTWIIASRPETHLKAAFSKPEVVSTCWEEEVPVDSDEACEDVEKFLHKNFTEIGENYPDHIHDLPWPTHKQFLKIAHAALGLFVLAEVIVRFIGDPDVGNPIMQLECVLLAISKMRSTKNQENPLSNLDMIYLAILSKIPPSTLQITKHLLGFLTLLDQRYIKISECDFGVMCQVLDISEDIGVTALRHLHSVLYFPNAKDLGTTRPRFYHASFRDFLEDESRSHDYFIDQRRFTLDQFSPNLVRVAQAQFSSDPDSPLSPSSGADGSLVSVFVEGVFHGDFSSDGVRFQGKFRWITDFLPDAQLQPLLESLNALKVLKYAGYALRWYYGEQDERELSRRGFLSCTTLGSLGISWGTVSISISKLGEIQHVQVDTMLGIQLEPHGDCPDVQNFRRLVAASDTKVWVWGHRKSGCRVAVVRLGHWLDGKLYVIHGIPLVTS